MEGPYEGDVPLGALRVNEELWGDGAEPIVLDWLREQYQPGVMPKLRVVSIKDREDEGLYVLGWEDVGEDGREWPSLLNLIFGDEYAQAQLDQVDAGIRDAITQLCPRCGVERFTPYDQRANATEGTIRKWPFPALSRVDNATYICTPCGSDEAMRDFAGEPPIPPNEWPINQTGWHGMGRL